MTYAPIVKAVAARKVRELPAHCELDDLVSAGLVALMTVVDRFDPTKGLTFEQYARMRISGAIIDELRRQDWAPRSLRHEERRHRGRTQRASHPPRPRPHAGRARKSPRPRAARPPPALRTSQPSRPGLSQRPDPLPRRGRPNRAWRHAPNRRRIFRPREGGSRSRPILSDQACRRLADRKRTAHPVARRRRRTQWTRDRSDSRNLTKPRLPATDRDPQEDQSANTRLRFRTPRCVTACPHHDRT